MSSIVLTPYIYYMITLLGTDVLIHLKRSIELYNFIIHNFNSNIKLKMGDAFTYFVAYPLNSSSDVSYQISMTSACHVAIEIYLSTRNVYHPPWLAGLNCSSLKSIAVSQHSAEIRDKYLFV